MLASLSKMRPKFEPFIYWIWLFYGLGFSIVSVVLREVCLCLKVNEIKQMETFYLEEDDQKLLLLSENILIRVFGIFPVREEINSIH